MKYNVLENIKLKISKGDLEVLPGQVIALQDNIAIILINEGRIVPIEKGVPTVPDIETELIPISDETLRDVFLEVMHRISDNYIEGTIKYIQEYHKDFDDVINTIDIQINEIWEKCNVGNASLDDFRNSLALYENIYKEAIEIYKKVKQ